MFNLTHIIPSRQTIEATTWKNRVIAAGGGFESNSLVLANNLARVLHSRSYYSKIKYLLPLLGKGIGAARVPLIDAFGVGSATNNNFVDGDFSQSIGLTGNGTNKYFNLIITPSQIGSTGGIGFWNRSTITSGDYRMGVTDVGQSLRYTIDLRSNNEICGWGSSANGPSTGIQAISGHYYGRRNSPNNCALFRDGVQIAVNTNTDSSTPLSIPMYLMAGNIGNTGADYADGTCEVAYLTDGLLDNDEIKDFHSVLLNYLITQTGRI